MFKSGTGVSESSGKGSAVSHALSLLGTAGGIGIAILLTPLLFGITKEPLLSYLGKAWGSDLAMLLTYTMGLIEGIVVYVASKLCIVGGATWALVSLAARRAPIA